MLVELSLSNVSKSYEIDNQKLDVVQNISFKVKKRESIAIVGPSGCGKTTLLRMIGGLEMPTQGLIKFQGKQITEPHPKIMMIFQSFALLPWKTVLENVELALLDRPADERREKALRFLDMVGLDGFEGSYPRELSGGMRQRVGAARALAREPDILLLDEPFSALDALTATNLRNDLLRFYYDRKLKPDVMILITHNIEEAVSLGERVIVLSKRPGKIVADIKIDLERPKNSRDEKFAKYVDQITSLIT
ncbi:ABC transporter ATP-binding protein [Candidatus Micrarchaeota archaeon]|nr:ABC transporter ATP-binding protein [Candidatus Micrarchaeota archaeon]